MRLRLFLLGFGNVGQGLAELLLEKAETLTQNGGPELVVTAISDLHKGSLYRPEGIDLAAALAAARAGDSIAGSADAWSGDPAELLREAEADVLVEVTYTDLETGEPGTSHIREAIARGLHVATTNKGPIALALPELQRLATDRGVRLLYEGTVMSGTPLLSLIRHNLAGAKIFSIQGILNGTTNYILTRMEEGLDYAAALAEAQERGYAEAVPDADVEGHDALAKVTILANAVFGVPARPDAFPCEGIASITRADIRAAAKRGRRYKLIGRISQLDDRLHGSVGPEEVELSHPLAAVRGAANAVTIATDTVGDVTIVGPGAGRRETGFALLNDILRIGGAA